MPSFGLCGQSYTTESPIASNQITRNWFPEILEDINAGQRITLNPTPGLSVWKDLGAGITRGHILWGSSFYDVSGATVYQVTSAGVATALGTISNLGGAAAPVSLAASSTQLMIIADGLGYYVDSLNALHTIVDANFPASVLKGEYSDGYFIAITATQIYLSALNDCSTWTPVIATNVQASTNALVSCLVNLEQLIVFGTQITKVFTNTGQLNIPYQTDPSGTIPFGSAAAFSAARVADSFFWLAADQRGQGIVIDAFGNKISTLAVDFAIQSFATISDAVGVAIQYEGHDFYQLSFPTAGATWRYDLRTKMWHEAPYWNTGTGKWEAHLGLFHTFAFGLHLMGSRRDGKIYQLSGSTYTDNGQPLRRLRRCPHLRTEAQGRKRIFYDGLEVLMQTGLGLAVAKGTLGYDPQLTMRFSDDGGRSWANDMTQSIGQIGAYKQRVLFPRLGSSYDRVFEIEFSDPIPPRIFDGVLEFTVGK